MLRAFGPQEGGLLTKQDLENYEVQIRKPMRIHYKDARLYCNPPPAAGGEMIACMLSLLEYADIGAHDRNSPKRTQILANAMKVADHFRMKSQTNYSAKNLGRWKIYFDEIMEQPLSTSPEITEGRGHTTHISIIDEESNAVGMTFSHGEGNGYIIPGTGIMMNNLMGEEDLHPEGWFKIPPGERLSTMMCPTLLHRPQKALIMMGTGGANRIRTAIVQTVNLLMDHQMSAKEAIAFPRIHFEGGILNAETFAGPSIEDLKALGPNDFVPFKNPSLFFGGVHMVMAQNREALIGAGDARRNGTCLKVSQKGQITPL
jgi:gamma-glutamyltranspeptidase/glutathione hydrolase